MSIQANAMLSLCLLLTVRTGLAAEGTFVIGMMSPVVPTGWGGFVPPNFQRAATALIMAVHHVNERNDAIVKNAKSLLPANFKLHYKFADTHFTTPGAVQDLLRWRSEEGYSGYTLSSCSVNNASTSSMVLQKYEAASSEKTAAIIGPMRSEGSQTIAVLAGLANTPTLSFGATSTTLSDKIRFPLFSRTCPTAAINALAMVNLMVHFNWRTCGVLYVNNAYGNPFISDFFRYTSLKGISIIANQKFTDQDSVSLRAAVKTLKESGARIFVYIALGSVNLQNILTAAAEEGITGVDGYAWLTADQNNPEADIQSMAGDLGKLRRFYSGWLSVVLDMIYGDLASSCFNYYSKVDPRTYYYPTVNMSAKVYKQPCTQYDALGYDAVWAIAIGLANMKPDMSDLNTQIRLANFYGASGDVDFDLSTGDRSAKGVHAVLQNVQPVTLTASNLDWNKTTLSFVEIGVWENTTGYTKGTADSIYWPGGRISLDPPPDTVTSGSTYLYVAIIVPCVSVLCICSCLLVYALWLRSRDDAGNKRLTKKIAELRETLRITRSNGFYLSQEKLPRSAKLDSVVIIQRVHMEAAAKLALWEDFDGHYFDAFCVSLQSFESLDTFSVNFAMPEEMKKLPYQKLREWLVKDVIQPLLQPDQDYSLMMNPQPVARKRTGSNVSFTVASEINGHIPINVYHQDLRFEYFQKRICKLRVLKEDSCSLFNEVKALSQTLMNQIVPLCDARLLEIAKERRGEELIAWRWESNAHHASSTSVDVIRENGDYPIYAKSAPEPRHSRPDRQDHETVQAIRHTAIDAVEDKHEKDSTLFSFCPLPQENVFVAQLARRAALLNHDFRSKIIEILSSKVSPEAAKRDTHDGSESSVVGSFDCSFEEGVGTVELHTAAVKSETRMQEKLRKYMPPHPRGRWPYSANILDPVRVSIVCSGPSHVLQVLRWFVEEESVTGLGVCRVKNKFSLPESMVSDGYRDVSLAVHFSIPGGLSIIGEIQIHDNALHQLKLKMHKLYKIKRANAPNMI